MGLRIANNISAMTTHRWLSVADTNLSKSLEKLSSGYRINRAADDAAGLAISEGFRADIASFKVASRNTSEASSMLQVAEGALDQINSMVIRLNELATQAASDNVGTSERSKINAEANKLIAEIERIADSTKYGSTALLNGAFGGLSTTRNNATETTVDSNYKIYKFTDNGAATDAVTLSVASGGVAVDGTWTLSTCSGAGSAAQIKITNGQVTSTTTGASGVFNFDELGITITSSGNAQTTALRTDTIRIDATGLSSTSFSVDSDTTAGTYTISEGTTGNITIAGASASQVISGVTSAAQTLDFSTLGIKMALTSGYDSTAANLNSMTLTVANSNEKTFQIGAENNTDNRLSVTISDTTTGASGLNVSALTLDSKANAQAALDTLDTALSTLASRRGDIGAYMNRLSYAAANLASTIENVQAAESAIRDVDMAAEMTTFTKNQILLQAGTAMLAQANMAPQQVLSLFG